MSQELITVKLFNNLLCLLSYHNKCEKILENRESALLEFS
jgi:hypothetical protein